MFPIINPDTLAQNWFAVPSMSPIYANQLAQAQGFGFDPYSSQMIWSVNQPIQPMYSYYPPYPIESRTTLTSISQDLGYGVQHSCPLSIEPIRSVNSQTSIKLAPPPNSTGYLSLDKEDEIEQDQLIDSEPQDKIRKRK